MGRGVLKHLCFNIYFLMLRKRLMSVLMPRQKKKKKKTCRQKEKEKKRKEKIKT